MSSTPERRSPRFVFLTDDAAWGARSRFAWRLDAANNRPLGRSVGMAEGLVACRASAAAVISGLARPGAAVGVEIGAEVERVGAYWTWRLDVPNGSATSTHRYLRRTECLRGFAQFVEVAGRADPGDGAVRCFGPATLRGYGVVGHPVGAPVEATS